MTDEPLLKDLRYRLVCQFLDFLILGKLKESSKPKSGRYLINYIYDTFEVSVDDGLMFSLLLMMERKGWIHGRSKEAHGRINRFFRLTEAGEKRLHCYLECKEDVINFMKVLLEGRTIPISH